MNDDFDVLCVGEAIVDLAPIQRGPLRGVRQLQVFGGGGPANVARGVARLGGRAAFVGVVGDDEFGHLLRLGFVDAGVDVAALRHTAARQTPLCFITIDHEGERHFMHRGGRAPRALSPEDVDPRYVARARALNFSTIALASDSGHAAVLKAIEAAPGLVCCDPGHCPPAWGEPEVVFPRLRAALERCHVVKCSADEAGRVAGEDEPEAAARALVGRGVELAVVTLSARGAVWARRGDAGHVGTPRVEVVDATGAGDAFHAALLLRLAREDASPADLPRPVLERHLRFASEMGAQAVRRLGPG